MILALLIKSGTKPFHIVYNSHEIETGRMFMVLRSTKWCFSYLLPVVVSRFSAMVKQEARGQFTGKKLNGFMCKIHINISQYEQPCWQNKAIACVLLGDS